MLCFLPAGSGNATKCYGNLGCLQITDEWYGITRPVNVLPVERHIINTRFFLTTRESLQQPRFLNLSQPHTILSSPFEGSRATKIIIHGFIDTGFVPWISVKKILRHLRNLAATTLFSQRSRPHKKSYDICVKMQN